MTIGRLSRRRMIKEPVAGIAAWILGRFARIPRPARFLIVGAVGLLTDLSAFTLIVAFGVHPLLARIASLAVATIVTWRLNRVFTFEQTTRHQADEATRYALVTLAAQATSYAVFSILVLSIATRLPQVAVIAGAAVGAIVSYTGHRLFAFAPRHAAAVEARSFTHGR